MSTAVTLTLDMRLGDQIIGERSFDPATETFTVYYTDDSSTIRPL
jgi:serine/threonine-protein kinase HipA